MFDPKLCRCRFLGSFSLACLLAIAPATLLALGSEEHATVSSVSIEAHTLPILVGLPRSPLVHLKLEVSGTTGTVTLTSALVDVSAGGEALERLQLLSTGAQEQPSTAANPDAFAGSKEFAPPKLIGSNSKLRFEGSLSLAPGVHHLWLAATVSANADIDLAVRATVLSVTVADPTSRTLTPKVVGAPATQRLGVALRKQGDDGSHTYRIPGLVATGRGTLIAVYDIRHRNSSDLPADVDVGMSRSTDGGRSWEAMRIIMDMSPHGVGGDDDPQWKWDGIGDPAILVDRETQAIWVAATWSHGDRAWRGSQPGLSKEDTGQLMLAKSDDDGVTWSAPINITAQVKHKEWSYLLQGPGKGITMKDGTLVFAAQFQDTPQNDRLPRSTILYSRDHGETWQIGTGSYDDTTEAQVVELEPGVLMLNSRYNRENSRVVMVTDDLGATWQPHPSSLNALIEPRSCMAGLIDVESESNDLDSFVKGSTSRNDGVLLFSNPDSLQRRERIMIKASLDSGATWPAEHRVLLDQGVGAGYSCMAMIDQETVGILYEGSLSQLIFQRIPLAEFLSVE